VEYIPGGLDQLLTTAQASRLFNVTAATIRKWAQHNHITARGMDRAGRKLYRLGDIADHELKTRVKSGRDNRERRAGLRIPA